MVGLADDLLISAQVVTDVGGVPARFYGICRCALDAVVAGDVLRVYINRQYQLLPCGVAHLCLDCLGSVDASGSHSELPTSSTPASRTPTPSFHPMSIFSHLGSSFR